MTYTHHHAVCIAVFLTNAVHNKIFSTFHKHRGVTDTVKHEITAESNTSDHLVWGVFSVGTHEEKRLPATKVCQLQGAVGMCPVASLCFSV